MPPTDVWLFRSMEYLEVSTATSAFNATMSALDPKAAVKSHGSKRRLLTLCRHLEFVFRRTNYHKPETSQRDSRPGNICSTTRRGRRRTFFLSSSDTSASSSCCEPPNARPEPNYVLCAKPVLPRYRPADAPCLSGLIRKQQ